MTAPPLATTADDGGRRYANPLNGRNDYISVTTIMGQLPSGPHGVPRDVLERAGRRGDFIHDLFETGRTCATDVIPPLDIPDAMQFAQSACKFMTAWQPRFVRQEMTVFSDRHGYAGTLDAIAEFGGGVGLRLADVKTSRDISPHVALQLAAYRYADYGLILNDADEWERVEIPDVDGCAVIWIRGDRHELVPINAAPEHFDLFVECIALVDLDHRARTAGYAAIRPAIPEPTASLLDTRRQSARDVIASFTNEARDELRTLMGSRQQNLNTATTHEQIDAIMSTVHGIESKIGTTPEWWNDTEADRVGVRMSELPPDLSFEFEATCKRFGVPNLRTKAVRERHLTYLFDRLKYFERVAAERAMPIARQAEDTWPDVDASELERRLADVCAVASSGDTDGVDYLQERAAERAMAMLEAIADGVLELTDGEVRPVPDTVTRLIDRHGSKKAVVQAGRDAADSHQLDRPRSTEQVAGDPTLAAVVYTQAA